VIEGGYDLPWREELWEIIRNSGPGFPSGFFSTSISNKISVERQKTT
jgi:hypothetical protein